MYVVQCRVNGAVVDEEHCVSLVEAWETIEHRRRVLIKAGAAIVVEDSRQYVVARTHEGWVTVTIVAGATQ